MIKMTRLKCNTNKFTGIYIESGYMKGNPLQTPLVLSGTGVRVCKK